MLHCIACDKPISFSNEDYCDECLSAINFVYTSNVDVYEFLKGVHPSMLSEDMFNGGIVPVELLDWELPPEEDNEENEEDCYHGI